MVHRRRKQAGSNGWIYPSPHRACKTFSVACKTFSVGKYWESRKAGGARELSGGGCMIQILCSIFTGYLDALLTQCKCWLTLLVGAAGHQKMCFLPLQTCQSYIFCNLPKMFICFHTKKTVYPVSVFTFQWRSIQKQNLQKQKIWLITKMTLRDVQVGTQLKSHMQYNNKLMILTM